MILCWISNAVASGAITAWALVHMRYSTHELTGLDFVLKTTEDEQKNSLKAAVLASFAYYISIWSLKLSILFQYHTLFEHLKKHMRWILIGATSATAAMFLILIIMNSTWCLPFERNYNILPLENLCISFLAKEVFLTSTIANIITDIISMYYLFLLPTSCG